MFQHIMKENVLFLKELLEPEETKFTNTQLQYQQMFISMN